MIRLMEAQGIPVPHMLWADPDGTWLERPFSIGRWLQGTADVATLVGTERAADHRRPVRRHARPGCTPSIPSPPASTSSATPTRETAALEQVELFELGYDKQRLEHFPAIEYMIRWLQASTSPWPAGSASSTATSGSATSCTTATSSSPCSTGSRCTSATRWRSWRSCTGRCGRSRRSCRSTTSSRATSRPAGSPSTATPWRSTGCSSS